MLPDLRKHVDKRGANRPLAWDNRGTNQDGPGSAPTLWIRGLADYVGVD